MGLKVPVPAEYDRASSKFYEFLISVRDEADLWSTHVTYTMVQGVLQVFRRRLTVQQAIDFANLLPICLRALFVTDWNTDAKVLPFSENEHLIEEVKLLRQQHNFSVDNAIEIVAKVVRQHVDEEQFDAFLKTLPDGALSFWSYR